MSDYAAMDRVLREERAYILDIVKQIKKAGCNVLLIQKSILRDAISDLALHFFDKMKIMVVKDVEREDIEHVCKSLGCAPVASLDHFTADKLASADLVEEVSTGLFDLDINRHLRLYLMVQISREGTGKWGGGGVGG